MPYAHDYYSSHEPHDSNDAPYLHNKGEGRPYLEYDYHANDHGPQLPAISTIGRGPRGEGLRVGNVVNEDGTVSFALYSDLTDELVWQSPNLDPGEIEFQPTDFRDLVPGSPAPLDILYKKGGITKTTTAYLPCGDRGSLVYLLGTDRIARNSNDTYQTTVGELVIYNNSTWANENKPIPRVNDIVFFSYRNETGVSDPGTTTPVREYRGSTYAVNWDMVDEITDNTLGLVGFGFGTIEAVGTHNNEEITPDTPVVFTARVFVPCYSELNEQQRIYNEQQRKIAEDDRQDAEVKRHENEISRIEAEQDRATAEQDRITAEESRISAESARIEAEQERVEEFGDMLNRLLTKHGEGVIDTTTHLRPAIEVATDNSSYLESLVFYGFGQEMSYPSGQDIPTPDNPRPIRMCGKAPLNKLDFHIKDTNIIMGVDLQEETLAGLPLFTNVSPEERIRNELRIDNIGHAMLIKRLERIYIDTYEESKWTYATVDNSNEMHCYYNTGLNCTTRLHSLNSICNRLCPDNFYGVPRYSGYSNRIDMVLIPNSSSFYDLSTWLPEHPLEFYVPCTEEVIDLGFVELRGLYDHEVLDTTIAQLDESVWYVADWNAVQPPLKMEATWWTEDASSVPEALNNLIKIIEIGSNQ